MIYYCLFRNNVVVKRKNYCNIHCSQSCQPDSLSLQFHYYLPPRPSVYGVIELDDKVAGNFLPFTIITLPHDHLMLWLGWTHKKYSHVFRIFWKTISVAVWTYWEVGRIQLLWTPKLMYLKKLGVQKGRGLSPIILLWEMSFFCVWIKVKTASSYFTYKWKEFM